MGATVTSVSVIDGDAGTSARARLAQTETRFYRELAPQLTGIPQSYGSEFDSVTGRFVLVLEDLAVDRCELPDTLRPLTPDQSSQVVELLARLHATYWERVPAWIYSISADTAALVTGPLLKTSMRRLAGKTDVPLGHGRFIADNYRAVAAVMDRTPNTVTHGDWQFVRRGRPRRELAYTLVTGMTTDDRRSHQRDLLDTYRRALAGAGGPELDREELWDRYRTGALYAYVAPLITAGMGGMQAEAIAMEDLQRGVAALEDLDTVALLEKSL